MELIHFVEQQQFTPPNGFPPDFRTFKMDCTKSNLSYEGRNIKRILIVAEKQRRIWTPNTRFFAYSGVHPMRGQQGIAVISDFRVDRNRSGRSILVSFPDPDNLSGNSMNIAGQFEFF